MMNGLSWMLYLADVAGSVNVLMYMVAFITGSASVFILVGWFVNRLEDPDEAQNLWGFATKGLAVTIGACLIAAATPSSETIYAIAASEVGEDALNSETGGKAVKALNAWLDRQVAGEPQ